MKWPWLVSRLVAAGFPKKMVRAIVSARIDDLSRPRFAALLSEEGSAPYWMMSLRGDSKQNLARQQLHRTKQELLINLLGEDRDGLGVPEPTTRILQQRLISSMPPEKRDEVQRFEREFDEKRLALEARLSAPVDEKEIVALEQARHTALAQVLSAAELTEYELRMSKSARSLRFDLAEFGADEAEFRRIFPLWQSFEQRFGERMLFHRDTPAEKRSRAEARSELIEQVKAALGPQRGEDYERTTDSNHQLATKLVARLQLPPETTAQLWLVQKETQQRARSIVRDPTLSPDEQIQQISALTEEARTKVTASLGEHGFEAYRRYGGAWMQDLLPAPSPIPSAK